MPIEANVKHTHHLEYYGEFATFDEADAHLLGEGWVDAGGLRYTKDGETLILKEIE